VEQQKSAFVAIVGRPNAGKSSLMNSLLGQKVVIVSDKPQTTRTRIMGVLTEGVYQYVFIDTPGFHKPRTALGENMIKAVGSGMDDVELCILVVDCTKDISPIEEELMEKFRQRHLPAILVLNKIDLVKNKEDLMALIAEYSSRFDFSAVIPTSALSGDGIERVKKEIQPYAAEGMHMFDEDTLTDQPERLIAAELIREKLLRLLNKEIPHGIAVVIERFYTREESDILDIEATIFCEKVSHKGIIIGKGGTMLKRAASYARTDLERFFDCKVNLQCWVKVKEDWRNREGLIHSFGLDS
jgi:GTP-binding protein Era